MTKKYFSDERGVTLVLVAMTLMIIVITFGFLLDVSVAFIKKQQLQNAAELGVSAGGRYVAEQADGVDLTIKANRDRLQSGVVATEAIAITSDYIKKNLTQYSGWTPADIDKIITVEYPKDKANECDDPASPDTLVSADINVPHTFMFAELLKKIGGSDTANLHATALYHIQLCPPL